MGKRGYGALWTLRRAEKEGSAEAVKEEEGGLVSQHHGGPSHVAVAAALMHSRARLNPLCLSASIH